MLVDLLRQLKACGGFFDLPSEAVGEALRSEGVSLLELGSLSEAERSLNEAERRFALADARIKQADAIAELGMVARKKGFRGNDELTYYQLAFELLPSEVSNETKRVRSKLLSRQAKTLEREGGNPDEILSYLTESLSLAREIGDERLTAFRLGQLGAAHRDIRRDYGTAIKCLDEALSIATRLKDNSSTVAALSGLGAAHENARHFLLAETRYKEALNGTITSDVYGMLDRLGRLGHVEGSLKKFKESEGYYRRAVELARKVENQRAEAQNLDGLGAILRTKAGETANVDRDQLLATALDCHSRAVKIQEALAGEPIGMANRYQELGRTLLALDRPQDARVLFIKALATLAGATESPRVRRLRAFQFQRLAETLEATGQREDAALCYAVAERDFGMRDRREQERAKKRLERILSNLDSGTRQILLPRLLHLERESQQLLQNLAEPGSVGA
jgi:tetratricopeptide (TPR) repeat protein